MADQAAGKLSPFLRGARMRASLPYLRGRILDFGCGVGVLADHVSPDRYMGIDRDSDSLERARTAHPHHRFTETWPHDERFDTVIALAVLEHLPDPLAFLKQSRAALNPGGRIVLTTPHPSWEWIHTAGAQLGLFSQEAHDEHETLLNKESILEIAQRAQLSLQVYSRFLGGANQLAVLGRC